MAYYNQVIQSNKSFKSQLIPKLMQALFQGFLFEVSKHEELPAYYLRNSTGHIGTIFLDSNRFYLSVSDLKVEVTGFALSFDINPDDFKLIDK